MTVRDTSKDYEHMIGYVADETLNRSSLDTFFGEETGEYKPEVRKKERDEQFPEDWQRLIVNFNNFEEYSKFMNKIGSKPVPKLKNIVYDRNAEETGLANFFGD